MPRNACGFDCLFSENSMTFQRRTDQKIASTAESHSREQWQRALDCIIPCFIRESSKKWQLDCLFVNCRPGRGVLRSLSGWERVAVRFIEFSSSLPDKRVEPFLHYVIQTSPPHKWSSSRRTWCATNKTGARHVDSTATGSNR